MCGFITSCICKNAIPAADIHGPVIGLTSKHIPLDVKGRNGHGPNKIQTNPELTAARSQLLSEQLQAAIEKIKHRGPDGSDVWISADGTVGLAHCRLSINDLSPSGMQPLHSDDGQIHAVVNGEIYDFDRLRKECAEQHGYVFTGESDSELVIALYKIHGAPRFLDFLRGEFAFVLFDEREGSRRVIAGRDRFGIKPLLWTVVDDDRVLFAAEAKAFLPMGWTPEWDVHSISDSGWMMDDRTVFKGVRKLMPGHWMEVTDERGIEIREYWNADYPDKAQPESRSVEEMIEGVRERLVEAIRLRLRADVPIGIYLSGGIDSSVVAGIVTDLIRKENVKLGSESTSRVACFSVKFPDDTGYDESDIADRTAQWLGVETVKVTVDEQRLADDFVDAAYHCEHHHLDLNSVAKFALSTLPREHGVKVVLTGEGSDEHFAGYTWFPVEFLRSADGGMPDSILTQDGQLRENLHNSVIDEMKKMWKAQGAAQYDLEDTDSEVATYASGNTMPDTMLALQAPSIMYQPWVHEQYKGKWDMRETVMKAHSPEVREKMRDKWHPAHTAMYMWNKTNLVNIILAAMGDRAEMAHSIEARTPFLDHHLAEYVNSLPPSVKLHYQPPQEHGVDAVDNFWWQSAGSVLRTITEKWILREAARPFITDELYKRRKVPFLAPVKWPRDGPIHKMFKNLLTREAVENLGFVDHGFIEKALEIGFGEDANSGAFRVLCVTGAWVTLSQRFGIKQATVEKSGWV